MAKGKNIKLQIPVPLVNAIALELEFLGVSYRTVTIEEHEVSSRNEFIRAVTEAYYQRFLHGFAEPVELDEETKFLTFCLDNHTQARWQTMIRDKAGMAYHDLTTSAIYDYFQRQERQTPIVASRVQTLKTALAAADFNQIREVLLS